MNNAACSISGLIRRYREELASLYPDREISSIFHLLMERLNYKKTEIYLNPRLNLKADEADWMEQALQQLRRHVPVQYVLGYGYFYGLKIGLGPGVLIPRPETEELVHWILEDHPRGEERVLDIGTGSGCIALALKQNRPGWEVFGLDRSEAALDISLENSRALGLEVKWQQGDILATLPALPGAPFGIIVSNPPYIPWSEKTQILPHVLEAEPHEALFVPDDDPLLFYRAISRFGMEQLSPGGCLYLEVHEQRAGQTARLLEGAGWDQVEWRRDIHDRWRMLKARRP